MRLIQLQRFGAKASMLGLFALLAGTAALAADPSGTPTPAAATTSPKPSAGDDDQARCQEMQAAHAAANARLEEKMNAMDAASGEAKVAAMAAALHELVDQHLAMHKRRMTMEGCEMMHGHGPHGHGHGSHHGHD